MQDQRPLLSFITYNISKCGEALNDDITTVTASLHTLRKFSRRHSPFSKSPFFEFIDPSTLSKTLPKHYLEAMCYTYGLNAVTHSHGTVKLEIVQIFEARLYGAHQ